MLNYIPKTGQLYKVGGLKVEKLVVQRSAHAKADIIVGLCTIGCVKLPAYVMQIQLKLCSWINYKSQLAFEVL